MIKNQNDLAYYSSFNKLYIPSDYLDSNFSFRFNGDYINIITNQNCYTQYSSTYCNCYLYNYKNNVISDVYICNTNSSLPSINYNYLTSDVNYSNFINNVFFQDKSILLIMVLLGVVFAKFLLGGRR